MSKLLIIFGFFLISCHYASPLPIDASGGGDDSGSGGLSESESGEYGIYTVPSLPPTTTTQIGN